MILNELEAGDQPRELPLGCRICCWREVPRRGAAS